MTTSPNSKETADNELNRETGLSFEQLFKKNPLPMWIFDSETLRCLDVNESASLKYGYLHEEFLQMDATLLRPEFAADGVTQCARPEAECFTYGGVQSHRLKNGDIVTVEEFSHEIVFNSRRAVIVTAHDITDRDYVENAIFENEQRLRDLIDFLPQTVYEMDMSGNLTFANRFAFEMFRITQEDWENGLNALDFIAPVDRERARSDIGRAIQTGKTTGGIEYTIIRKDGTLFPAIQYGNVILKDGKPAGLRGLIVDITTQKENERLAIALRDRFAAIFNNARDALLLLKQNMIVDCNEAAYQVFGGDRNKIIGAVVEDLSPAIQADGMLSKEKAAEKISAALQGESQFFEWQHSRLNDEVFDCEVSLSKVVIDGEPMLLAVLRDITERKLLEEQLRQSQKLESLGQLTSGIAHDFNNILGGIIGFSQLALRKASEGSVPSSCLERINMLAMKAAGVTKQLLAFSRKQFLQPKYINLNDLVADFLQLVPRIIRENVSVRFVAEKDLDTVYVDPPQIEQVLLNLILNANDAMPGGGELLLETRNSRLNDSPNWSISGEDDIDYVILAVTDTGTGIEKSVLERIYEPFFTTKEVGKGTGLGLSVVHGIVKQHNGSIHLRTELGKGTTFEIFLPSAKQRPENAKRESEELPCAKDASEKILVVEDNEEMRQFMAAFLRENGYEVIEAADGEEGAQLYDSVSGGVSLVISDIVMPKMSGRELRQSLLERDPRVKFLFVSGYDRTSGTETPFPHDVDFMAKPFGVSELSKKVREILDRK